MKDLNTTALFAPKLCRMVFQNVVWFLCVTTKITTALTWTIYSTIIWNQTSLKQFGEGSGSWEIRFYPFHFYWSALFVASVFFVSVKINRDVQQYIKYMFSIDQHMSPSMSSWHSLICTNSPVWYAVKYIIVIHQWSSSHYYRMLQNKNSLKN